MFNFYLKSSDFIKITTKYNETSLFKVLQIVNRTTWERVLLKENPF